MNRIQPLLNRILPISTAVNALGKINPSLKKFFSHAATWGYPAEEALEFLRTQFEGSGREEETKRLKEGMAKGDLRPDQKASLAQREHDATPINMSKGLAGMAGKAGMAGLGATALQGLGNQPQSQPSIKREALQPDEVLNEDIEAQQIGFSPDKRRGLSAPVDQGDTINMASPHQLRAQQAMDKRQGTSESESPISMGSESRVPIMEQPFDLETLQAQYPDLYKFIVGKMQKGTDPSQIATVAKVRFAQPVTEIEQMIQTPFGQFLEETISMRRPTRGSMQAQQGQQQSGAKSQLLQTIAEATQIMQGLRGGR